MSGNVEYLYIGNENKPLSELNGYESGSFTIGADIPGDPAYGCAKNFVSNYMCGTQIKSINMDGESGGNVYVLSRFLAKSIGPVFGAFLRRTFTVDVSGFSCRMDVRPGLAWWATFLLVSLPD